MSTASRPSIVLYISFMLAMLIAGLAVGGCQSEQETATPKSSADASTSAAVGSVERLEPGMDALVPEGAQLEVIAEGFEWTEGPVWVPDGGYLLFSDIPRNSVYKWEEGAGTRLWLKPSGYTSDESRGGEMGSNALLLDAQGRLILCQHGDRQLARLDTPLSNPAPRFVTLASTYQGQRFNSPNDAALHSSGAFYVTDPPYGLEQGPDDPARELDFSGVYRVDPKGTVTLLTDELTRPNGIAFSPDEKTLYVSNSDPERAIWMAYDVQADGTITNGRVFFDATQWTDERQGLPDGLEVDRNGNVFATGPGGIWVFSPEGTHLGTIHSTEVTSNVAFGNHGSTLYITADNYLMRIRLSTVGAEFD